MKKLLAVLLALTMLMSLNIITFADNTTCDVTADYTALINGITVTGNSDTTTDGKLIFADNDFMKITVSGKNLDIATVANKVYWGNSFGLDLANTYSDYFTVNEDGSTATFEFQYDSMAAYFPKNYQMYYTNNGETLVATGIYIYCEEGATANITKMEIISGATYDEASGVYNIAYGSRDDVVVKISGSLINYADENTIIRLPLGDEVLSIENGWTFSADQNSAVKSFDASSFYMCTTVYTIQYSTDGVTFNDGCKVLYESVNVGVDITWGAMSFTYAANAWTADGNTVTVAQNEQNESTYVDVTAAFAFSDDAANLGVDYAFNETETTLVTEEAPSFTFTLTLSGKPTEAFSGKIGTVTLTIAQGTGVDYEADEGVMPLL